MLELEKKIRDEISFWRWFIAEKEKTGDGFVPTRARQALAFAEQKLAVCREEQSQTKTQLPNNKLRIF